MIAPLLLIALVTSPPFAESPRIELDPDPAIDLTLVDSVRSACSDLARQRGAPAGPWRLSLRQASTVDDFVRRTGRARFEAAALVGGVLWLQPPAILSRLGDPAPILAHECAHAWLRAQRVPPLPPALEEVLAIGLSGGIGRLPPSPPAAIEDLPAIDRELAHPPDRQAAERAIARAAARLWPVLAHWIEEGALLERLRALPSRERFTLREWQAFGYALGMVKETVTP